MKQVKVINTKTGESRYINEKTARRADLMERHNLVIADEIEARKEPTNTKTLKNQNDEQEKTPETSPALLSLRKAGPVIEAMETVEAIDDAIAEEEESQARKTVLELLHKQKDKLNES